MRTIETLSSNAMYWTLDVLTDLRRVSSRRLGQGERGDVPGWVLITIMTAGLVTLLWGIAGNTFQQMFTSALAAVTGPR